MEALVDDGERVARSPELKLRVANAFRDAAQCLDSAFELVGAGESMEAQNAIVEAIEILRTCADLADRHSLTLRPVH